MTDDRDTYPVRWTDGQTVVTLPAHIDVFNAGQIREELLLVINRGAAALIADMTTTLSCDHAGADALVRVYQRALASGTQLRLVVTSPVVQRVLIVNGLNRLIPIYPSLEAALAAGAEPPAVQVEPERGAITQAVPQAAGLPPASGQADRAEELLDWVVNRIFAIGVLLDGAHELPSDDAGPPISEALHQLDNVVREVRRHILAMRVQAAPLDTHQRLTQATDRVTSLQERAEQTARALQSAAADTVALLQQQAGLAGPPGRADYPAEIKRWRAFADQAEQMAKYWEQRS